MVAFLIGLVLFGTPAASNADLEDCRAIGPQQSPPAIASLNEAQKYWQGGTSVPADTLEAHLDRVKRARACYLQLDPATVSESFAEDLLWTYAAEARLHAALRNFSAAFDAYRDGISRFESMSSSPYTGYRKAEAAWPAFFERQQGYLHYVLGDLSASIEHYLNAYRAATAPSARVEHLINVGILLQRAQDYASAEQYYRRAQRQFRQNELRGENPAQWARLLHNRADLLIEQTLNTTFRREPLRQARNLSQRARDAASPNTEQYARITLVLSEASGYLGYFESAYRLNRSVREFADTQALPELRALSLLKFGVLDIQTERWARADRTLREARALAKSLHNLDYQRRIQRALGRLCELRGEWRKAERHYRQGIEVIEAYRSSLTASQWSMTAFAQWRDVHRGLVRALLAQDRDREALVALDRSRARHLQDLRTQSRVANVLGPSKHARLDSLSRALRKVRTTLASTTLSRRRKAILETRKASLMAARQQLLRVDSVARRPSLEAVSDSLDTRDRDLVSYFIDAPWPVYDRNPRSVAFVLTNGTVRTVPLPDVSRDSVQRHIERVSSLFSLRQRSDRANAMHFNLEPLHALYEALYAPVAEALPENRPLTVIPDGPLFRIPFSMLVQSMPEGRFAPAAATFVLHDRAVSYELASSLVAAPSTSRPSSSASSSSDVAAFGVASFDSSATAPPALRAKMPSGADSSLTLPPLPGVRSELKTLNDVLDDSRIFLNGDATEETFWSKTKDADVVHLASHAFVHPTTPLQNAFLLHRSAPPDTTDGILYLHELHTRQRPFSLVVLSGCNTARGSLHGGEGMEGLQYAFRAMGTRATVSSLWPVADRANASLMQAFYGHLGDDVPKDEALRRAKLEVLESRPRAASPFFWAPTVLYGSSSPIAIEAHTGVPIWGWWMAGAVLLVGVAALLQRWRPLQSMLLGRR